MKEERKQQWLYVQKCQLEFLIGGLQGKMSSRVSKRTIQQKVLTRVRSFFRVNAYKRSTETGFRVAVIHPGLETNLVSCKETLNCN